MTNTTQAIDIQQKKTAEFFNGLRDRLSVDELLHTTQMSSIEDAQFYDAAINGDRNKLLSLTSSKLSHQLVLEYAHHLLVALEAANFNPSQLAFAFNSTFHLDIWAVYKSSQKDDISKFIMADAQAIVPVIDSLTTDLHWFFSDEKQPIPDNFYQII